MFSDRKKQQIIEEEKLRQEVKQNEEFEEEKKKKAIQNKNSTWGCLGSLVFIILLSFLFYQCTKTDETKEKNNIQQLQQEAQNAEKQKESIVNELYPKYCENHQQLRLIKIDKLVNDGYPMFDGIGGFNDEECKTIIGKLYDIDSNKDDLMNVAEKKYWIGMDYRLLIYSIGTPNDMNSTTTYQGSHNQLIYGDPLNNATYIYVDDGIVSSYQNF